MSFLVRELGSRYDCYGEYKEHGYGEIEDALDRRTFTRFHFLYSFFYFFIKMGKWEQVNIVTKTGKFGEGSSDISGNYAIVGDRTNATGTNTVRWYEKNTKGDWTEVSAVTKGNGFGFTVSISGNYSAVSSPGGTPEEVYIYERRNGTWTEIQTLTGSGDTSFGVGLALDGNYLVVGETNSDPESAHLYVRKPDGDWELFETVTSSVERDNLNFGSRVRVSGDNVMVCSSVSVDGDLVHVYKIKAYEERGKRMELLEIIDNGGYSGGAGDINGNYMVLANSVNPSKVVFYQNTNGKWKEIVRLDAEEQAAGVSRATVSGDVALVTSQAQERIRFYRRNGKGDWEITDIIPQTPLPDLSVVNMDGNNALLSFAGNVIWYQYTN